MIQDRGSYAVRGHEETLLKTGQVLTILELSRLALALQEDHRKVCVRKVS